MIKKSLLYFISLFPLFVNNNLNSFERYICLTNKDSNEFLSSYEQEELHLSYAVPIAEGDYSRNGKIAEHDLTTRSKYAYANNYSSNRELIENFRQIRIKFDVRVGINEISGSDYNYYDSYLWLIVDLSSAINGDTNKLSESGKKTNREMLVPGWKNKEAGYYTGDDYYVTYVFEHTTGNYDKWVFLNTCVVLGKSLNFEIRYNGAYRFRSASFSKKYINIYVDPIMAVLSK